MLHCCRSHTEAVPAWPQKSQGWVFMVENEMAEFIQVPQSTWSKLWPLSQAGESPGRGSCQGHTDSAPCTVTPDGWLAGGAWGHGEPGTGYSAQTDLSVTGLLVPDQGQKLGVRRANTSSFLPLIPLRKCRGRCGVCVPVPVSP